ncbi:MAG: hypothetical protein IT291_08305 [Deltaproteobacteria bacterium]|nr:hypothetical protein [Deltaproteobacteria bacterium]
MFKTNREFCKSLLLVVIVGTAVRFIVACAPALPVQDPETVVVQASAEIDESLRRSQMLVDESSSQLELSRKILAEARALIEEARSREKRCIEALNKVPKRRPIVCRPVEKPVEKKPEEKKDEGTGVLYSPSDAP